MSPRCSS